MEYLIVAHNVDEEELEHMNKCCVVLCIFSMIVLSIIVVLNQNFTVNYPTTSGKDLEETFILTMLVILVSMFISIFIQMLAEYAYKIYTIIA